MLQYKIVKFSTVTDQDLEIVINKTVAEGWNFDGMNFAKRDSSKKRLTRLRRLLWPLSSLLTLTTKGLMQRR